MSRGGGLLVSGIPHTAIRPAHSHTSSQVHTKLHSYAWLKHSHLSTHSRTHTSSIQAHASMHTHTGTCRTYIDTRGTLTGGYPVLATGRDAGRRRNFGRGWRGRGALWAKRELEQPTRSETQPRLDWRTGTVPSSWSDTERQANVEHVELFGRSSAQAWRRR